jgi:hypothetical protein
MATLGSTAKPTDSIEWFGLNSVNQVAMALTLPAGGPWKITHVGGWLAGRGSVADYRLVLWNGAGTLLRYTALGSVASQALANGNLASAYMPLTSEYEATGGQTVYVGFWRHPSDPVQNGGTSSGSHIHSTVGSAPANFGSWSTHSGGGLTGFYLTYEPSNQAPTQPSWGFWPSNNLFTDTTPTISWTHNDPDGDPQAARQVQIATNSSFSSGMVVDTGKVNVSSGSYTTPALTRGTTYYVRVRTWDNGSLVSPWSATKTMVIAGFPTGSVTSPSGSVAAPLYYTAGSNTTPKLKPTWSFSCPNGGTQWSAVVRVYDAAGSSLLHTHNHSGTALTANVSGFAPTNGTKYQISVQVTCSHGIQQASESSKQSCQVRWGRASYRADLGVAPLTLSVSVSSTLNSGQVIMEYASSAATTPEPGTYKATVAEITKQRYIWHRVTLIPNAVASPTSPTLNSLTFSYSANVLVPDNWSLSPVASVDEGVFVYGTQSIRHEGDGTERVTEQVIENLTPNTDYILSGRIKTTDGTPAAALVLRTVATNEVVAEVIAPADTDWDKYAAPVWDSGETGDIKVQMRTTGTGTAFFDALKLEASRVVTPWTPGFLGAAVVIDSGGIIIDGQKGGVFRLRGGNGIADVKLGDAGLHGQGMVQTLGLSRLAAEVWYPNATTVSLSAGTDADVAAGFRVTYPGNPAMVGRKVVLRVWCEMAQTLSAIGEFNVSLMANGAIDNHPASANRITFARQRVNTAATFEDIYTAGLAVFDATASREFKILIRHAAAATWTPYGNATADYVSRIGYEVIGYY